MSNIFKIIPFFKQNETSVKEPNNEINNAKIWMQGEPVTESDQFFPFTIKKPSEDIGYTLPYEPMIDIEGGNNIIRRYVAKAKYEGANKIGGSIKERWNSKDYTITIRGILMGSMLTGNIQDCYPLKDFNRLKNYLTVGEIFEVFCEPLQLLDIHRVVIESFSFPFTKGENVQAYEIKAFSDHSHPILIELDEEN
ncbi:MULTISPECIES: DUF6046 domain-containing protein [Bizionia]|uniref:DUF6046 domain-containing protein n=1 Tax=Bizionia algoritergicola TaxID=291187 RepID=A0A5D0R0F6_9FLAO|nr:MULTISPECIES: DUF6046 domain-containing protein [Bizionia]OBX17811.1 hypothetical protein BAA08_15765 [Bizionia sp. APA-3]TYB74569.1 hypothetical protein ES675_00040 [Bizionia algoritergicola]